MTNLQREIEALKQEVKTMKLEIKREFKQSVKMAVAEVMTEQQGDVEEVMDYIG
jgi:hypothetical protein